MVSGIAAIHKAGVIHRDIKPSNVMVERSGPELCLSIMDFGLARLYASATTMQVRTIPAGTPGYLVPGTFCFDHRRQAISLRSVSCFIRSWPATDPSGHRMDHRYQNRRRWLRQMSLIYIQTVRQLLSQDPQRRCDAFEQCRKAIEVWRERLSFRAFTATLDLPGNFAIASAASVCVVAGVTVGYSYEI